MDDRSGTALMVRCSSCHSVYEQADSDDGSPGCPECGELVWIAAEIPLPSAAASAAT